MSERDEHSRYGVTLGYLAEHVQGSQLRGDPSVVVYGVQHDSREVVPGDLFACIVGERFDGHAFARDAIARGAIALLAESRRLADLPPAVPCLSVTDTRVALPEVSAAVYGRPSHSMRVVGVTGTNGKTTTTVMIESIAAAAGLTAGRIGTLGVFAAGLELPSAHTTPEADDLQRMLAQMRDRGVQMVAMEVSSHGLALHRTDCTSFDVGVFTNLTQDHLDFHGTMEALFQAKLRLFAEYPRWSRNGFVGVVNVDDPRGQDVARATKGRTITYGMSREADLRARNVLVHVGSVRFETEGISGNLQIELPIGGAFQVSNALGAIGAALALGLPTSAIVEGLRSMEPVPGRFEAVATSREWNVIVDFAHTPDGLQSLLASARSRNPARIILVFGCGGNRDRTKRPVMGRIAGAVADVVIVTSDNPRHEEPHAIIREILPGLDGSRAEVYVEADRRKAIELALRMAQAGDLILLAGKGGEREMIIGDDRIPYDDREVVRELLEEVP
jgi:UDP-N-acetylmuramoyl-L-alanyl-D-glutamate--2,6-diaminopimelate ligase